MLWIILTVLTSIAAVMVTVPFINRISNSKGSADPSITVYKDQIEELSREKKQGLIDADSAKIASIEIERRILASVKSKKLDGGEFTPGMRFFAMISVGSLVVLGSTTLYTFTGKPELPSARFLVTQGNDQPASNDNENSASVNTQSAQSGITEIGNVEEMVAGLENRLKQNPNDVPGWRMLGWSYFNTDKYTEAAEAYGKAVALESDDSDLQSAYGEAIIRASNGLVTDEAMKVVDKTLALNAKDSRARFFKGLAREQAGDPQGAIDIWIAILNEAPAEAEWIEGLNQRVQELAAAQSIDISDRVSSNSTKALTQTSNSEIGPTSEEVRAALGMTDEDRQEMIRGMVNRLASRLEENPRDAEGWIKLMRSRIVLGEMDAAKNALFRASDVFSNEPATKSQIISAAKKLGLKTD